jgi:hypothetical protein
MTAAQAATVISNWVDVTQQAANPVLASQSAATNQANLNTILSAVPNGATIYFPANATPYSFTGAITLPAKMLTLQGQGENRAGSPATAYTMLELTTAGDALFTLDANSYWYTTFNDICFLAGVVQNSTGACAVNVNGNVGVNFRRCSWQSTSSSNSWYNCINMLGDSGSGSGNQTVIDGCNFSDWTNYGVALSASGSSLVVTSSVFQGNQLSTPAAAGIQCGWVGALQIDNCDIVGCVNNLLVNPVAASSEVAASIYFDDAAGSCLLITGTGATVRCKFTNCSFTVAAGSTAYNAVQVNSTSTTAGGLDFVGCNVLNTFGNSSTSTNGFSITGAADFRISDCNISGWDGAGIALTGMSTSGLTKPVIINNIIGPSCGYGGNGTGIAVTSTNAFGYFTVQGNVISGNTVNWSQTANITIASGSNLMITNNPGFLTPVPLITALLINTATPGQAAASAFLPIGVYQISGYYVGTIGATVAGHSFQWAASGGLVAAGTALLQSSVVIPLTAVATTATFDISADATYTTALPMLTATTAADIQTAALELSLTVTTAGTLTLNCFNATAADTISLGVGGNIQISKIA